MCSCLACITWPAASLFYFPSLSHAFFYVSFISPESKIDIVIRDPYIFYPSDFRTFPSSTHSHPFPTALTHSTFHSSRPKNHPRFHNSIILPQQPYSQQHKTLTPNNHGKHSRCQKYRGITCSSWHDFWHVFPVPHSDMSRYAEKVDPRLRFRAWSLRKGVGVEIPTEIHSRVGKES